MRSDAAIAAGRICEKVGRRAQPTIVLDRGDEQDGIDALNVAKAGGVASVRLIRRRALLDGCLADPHFRPFEWDTKLRQELVPEQAALQLSANSDSGSSA
jgi:hypothetical protein